MASYGEKVKEIFANQGFSTDEKQVSGFGMFYAEKDDDTLAVGFSEKKGRETVEKILRSFSEIADSERRVFFTPDDSDVLGSLGEELEVDVSYFDPFDKSDEMEEPENMPSSYEILGDVAVLTLEDDQLENKSEIAEYLVHQNPNVETVLNKVESLSGEFRVGGYEKIFGERTETVHREHGARLKLDPTKTFFSERLSHERQRVVEQVSEGETVQVWFAGVGPYPIITALKRNPGKVYAIEKNPDACGYMKENIKLNHVEGTVEAFCGDVREIAPDIEKADRIIMPLPKGARTFLGLAFDCLKKEGIIHYYRFASREERWEKIEEEINEVAGEKDRDVEIIERELCGHYAPYVHRVCVDFRVY